MASRALHDPQAKTRIDGATRARITALLATYDSLVSKDNIAKRRLSELDEAMETALSQGQDPWKATARELFALAAFLQSSLSLTAIKTYPLIP